ncbi:hypothetical protein OH77DRAFT_619833 [Trametes cingulata]|nr:hypothetical protein OH77DRAFT_619833 [Trametes cingulata]
MTTFCVDPALTYRLQPNPDPPAAVPEPIDYINRLPAELILHIFMILHIPRGRIQPPGFRMRWIRVTWVCRRWREIALGCGMLWTSLTLFKAPRDVQAISTLLNNTRGAPLNLNLRPEGFEYFQSAVNPILALAVLFKAPEASQVGSFIKLVGRPIRRLVLSLDAGQPELKFCIRSKQLPHLRELAIMRLTPVVSGTFKGLTWLTVNNVWAHPETTLYNLLAACPNLETLVIRDSLPLCERYVVQNPGDLIPIHLPRLRDLRMEPASAWDLGWFLQWIRLPATAAFHITASYAGYPPDPDEFEGWLAGHLFPQPLNALPIVAQARSVAVRLGSGTPGEEFALFGSSEVDLRVHENERSWSIVVPSFDRSWNFPPAGVDEDDDYDESARRLPDCCPHALAELPELIDPSRIVVLQMHVAPGLPVNQDWNKWLASFTSLRYLIVGGTHLVARILVALRARIDLLLNLEVLQFCLAVLPEDPDNAYIDPVDFAAWVGLRRLIGRGLKAFSVRVPAVPTVQTTALAAQLLSHAVAEGVGKPACIVSDTCQSCHFVFDTGESDEDADGSSQASGENDTEEWAVELTRS